MFDRDLWPVYSFLALCLIVIGVGVYISNKDEKAWRIYAAQHHCRIVGTKAGQITTGVGSGSNGQVVSTIGTTFDQNIYMCDNNEIEIR